MIHVRHICYLKITFCFTETLMGISKRTSSSASEDEISSSASEDVISDARIRRSTCAYAEAWWTDLRVIIWTLIKTTTIHQHLSSVRISQSENTLEWQQYCIQDALLPTASFQTRSSQFGKNVIGIETKSTDSNVPFSNAI